MSIEFLKKFSVLLFLQEGVEVRVARIFNTFGSRMHMNDGRVVSNFILQALQGEPLTVCILSFLLARLSPHLYVLQASTHIGIILSTLG